MVRDQTLFLADQFKELDMLLEARQGMVSKYKTLNATHKQTMEEKQELANELARLKSQGLGSASKTDPNAANLMS